jgi:hypothetical protein
VTADHADHPLATAAAGTLHAMTEHPDIEAVKDAILEEIELRLGDNWLHDHFGFADHIDPLRLCLWLHDNTTGKSIKHARARLAGTANS